VDGVHTIHSLDRSNGFGNSDWIRHPLHLLAMLQLHHRFVSHVVSAPCLAPKSLSSNANRFPDSAASAVAANSLIRSLAGAGFPLFAVQTFDNLGIQWAGTLLGCLATAMIPIPFIFYRWGPEIRAKSKFAPATSIESLEEPEDGEKQV
jgi:hypothetical protein